MKTKKHIRAVLIVFFACVLAVSATILIKYFSDSRRAKNSFSEIQDVASDALPDENGGEEQYAENGMLAGYYELWKRNSDMVGWIRIDGTVIDYPVMYKADDWQFYMKHDFDKNKQSHGLPFADVESNVFKPSTNIVLYAHNMRDKTMFAALHGYEDKAFWEEHRTVNFDTLYRRGTYEVIAALETTANDTEQAFKYNQSIEMDDPAVFKAYVDTAKQLAFYDTGVSAEPGEELLTLSTCSYGQKNGRLVVIAKRLWTEEEKKAMEAKESAESLAELEAEVRNGQSANIQ